MRLLGRGRVPRSVRERVINGPHPVQPPRIIVAGNHRQAMDWCRTCGVDHTRVVVVTNNRDANRLRGHRFTSEQVAYVGTWYENETEALEQVIKARIIMTERGVT